jgi:hypothetical protein
VCVECLIGKQKKPILFKVTEPSSIPYRTPPACAKWRRTLSKGTEDLAGADPETELSHLGLAPPRDRGLLAEQDRDD